MKSLLTVIKFTAKDMLGRKSFRISTIIILILIVLGFNVPAFLKTIGSDSLEDEIIFSDPDNVFEGQLENLTEAENLTYKPIIVDDDYEKLKTKIENGEASSAILITKSPTETQVNYIVKNTATVENFPTKIAETLSALYTNLQISKLHLSKDQLESLDPHFDFQITQTEDVVVGGNIFVMMILSVILFFAIYFCAYQVSSSITTEKTSRIIETLVTSTAPRNIVLGKTIGIGLVGLFQVALFATVAALSAYAFLNPEILNAMLDLSNFTPFLILIIIIYFILGYFMYALLYALTGSTVSKPEDIQSANMPISIISMVGFYLAYFTLMNPTGDLNILASLLPISSPFCMPLRVMMGIANGWDIALSLIILIVTCVIIAIITIRIYSNAILNYGTKTSLKEIFKMAKEK